MKYSIVHCQSKLVVGFVAYLLEIMTDFVIYCPEIKVHTFWEGHTTVTKSPKFFELKKLSQMYLEISSYLCGLCVTKPRGPSINYVVSVGGRGSKIVDFTQ